MVLLRVLLALLGLPMLDRASAGAPPGAVVVADVVKLRMLCDDGFEIMVYRIFAFGQYNARVISGPKYG